MSIIQIPTVTTSEWSFWAAEVKLDDLLMEAAASDLDDLLLMEAPASDLDDLLMEAPAASDLDLETSVVELDELRPWEWSFVIDEFLIGAETNFFFRGTNKK